MTTLDKLFLQLESSARQTLGEQRVTSNWPFETSSPIDTIMRAMDQIEENQRLAEEQRLQEQFDKDKSDAEYFVSEEFRQEVIDEIIAEGATILQAQGRTRDQLRTFQEAQRLGLM